MKERPRNETKPIVTEIAGTRCAMPTLPERESIQETTVWATNPKD